MSPSLTCFCLCHWFALLLSSLVSGLPSDVRLLHTALTPETLDLPSALQLVDSLETHEVNIPIYGDRPLLHHSLNLYFMSQSTSERATLVELMFALISKRVDINAPYSSDPDVVFKAVVIRELGLAHAMVGGGGLTNKSISLTQLYSVPCDPIPLSKLLLHAQTVVSKQKNQADQIGVSYTLENVKSLLAGASLGAGSKPTAKAVDLYTHSPSFEFLLGQMLSSESRQQFEGLSLQVIIDSLGELGSAVHKKLLHNFLEASSDKVDGLSHLANLLATFDKQGRNALHTLALSGSSRLVNDLVDLYSLLNDIKSKRGRRVRGKLGVALKAVDIRGHSPLAYVALRYGPTADIYYAFRKLANVAQLEVDEVLMEFMFSSHEKKRDKENRKISDDDVDRNDNSGGWSTTVVEEDLRGDPLRCDILEVWSGEPKAADFFIYYLSLGKPVVFRNAMQLQEKSGVSSIRKLLERDRFLQKYGGEIMPVSTIPYASSFGVGAEARSLKEVADMADNKEEEIYPNLGGDKIEDEKNEVPLYAFNTAHPSWREQIEDEIGLPSLIDGLVKDVEMQFYLGQAGTGAPMHYHGHAVNSLAYGEKKWFLLPPSQALYSKTPSLEFAQYLLANKQGDLASKTMQCTQRAGDLMYVPTLWGHATLNTKQSIGVAHEFSVDDICME